MNKMNLTFSLTHKASKYLQALREVNQTIDAFSTRAIIDAPYGMQFTDRIRMGDMNNSGSTDNHWGDCAHYKYVDFTGVIKPRLLKVSHNGLGRK